MSTLQDDARRYHAEGRPGKIEVCLTKPCATQRDLSLAYTPGVATPCLDIEKDPEKAYEYTAKGNLVAVVSNGTAVLGLGDIGALAGKPVMEGKGVLFKRFADVDVFDIEVNEKDPKKLIEIVAALEPTFGGINLEDIKAPECFEVEQTLKQRMNIPVFHDDQHGTAIISAAGLVNALEIQGKKINEVKVVVAGAGAAAIACANLWMRFGVKREHIFMCDSKGVLHEGRRGSVDKTKEMFLQDTKARTLADALKGADVFMGLSKGNTVTAEMAKTMASKAVIFAMANPDPEIPFHVAKQALPDAIIATGRSDFPNQVNNVLGFPFIFRGALDAGAKQITEEMKMAASKALAALAREDVPDSVRAAYGDAQMSFGRDYIIPKPLDERVLLWEAPAVAQAAIECGVARKKLNMDEYKAALERRLGPSRMLVRNIVMQVKASLRTLVFPEADDPRVIRACRVLVDDGIAKPVLLGDPDKVNAAAKECSIDLKGIEVVDIAKRTTIEQDIQEIMQVRGRHGMTIQLARQLITSDPTVVALMMVRKGLVDGAVAGIHHGYPETIRMALKLVGVSEGVKTVAGVHVMVTKNGPMFFADTTVNIDPSAQHLADIAIMTARFTRELGIEPHVGMLCYSNFGTSAHPEAQRIREAVKLIRSREPELDCDGEIQVQVALDDQLRSKMWPQCKLKAQPNVLVFPSLGAANTAYQLVARLGAAEEIGPVLLGLRRPVTVISPRAKVNTIVQMAAMTALHGIKGSAWGRASLA